VAEGVLTRTAPGFDSVPRNLLDNAIKYSPPGGRITVALSAEGDRARLTVSDTGEGIPPEKVDRLFRKFERLGAEKGAQEGHGLGLSIVAKLVELSAGTVHVEDRTDGRPGAVFRVEVPLAQAPM
jgi:signal transduction histidine kinase